MNKRTSFSLGLAVLTLGLSAISCSPEQKSKPASKTSEIDLQIKSDKNGHTIYNGADENSHIYYVSRKDFPKITYTAEPYRLRGEAVEHENLEESKKLIIALDHATRKKGLFVGRRRFFTVANEKSGVNFTEEFPARIEEFPFRFKTTPPLRTSPGS